MVGMATGLAEAGFVPFVYSIVTFATLRPYEFIRNGPVFTGCRCASSASAAASSTARRAQPPRARGRRRDAGAARHHRDRAGRSPPDGHARCAPPGTCPGRSTTGSARTTSTAVPGLDGRFALGRARDGPRRRRRRARHQRAASRARRRQPPSAWRRAACDAALLVVASLQPAPVDDLVAALARVPLAVTVEAHYVTGGLGSLVAEVHRRARARLPPAFAAACARRTDGRSGSQRYLHDAHGLSAAALVRRALAALGLARR